MNLPPAEHLRARSNGDERRIPASDRAARNAPPIYLVRAPQDELDTRYSATHESILSCGPPQGARFQNPTTAAVPDSRLQTASSFNPASVVTIPETYDLRSSQYDLETASAPYSRKPQRRSTGCFGICGAATPLSDGEDESLMSGHDSRSFELGSLRSAHRTRSLMPSRSPSGTQRHEHAPPRSFSAAPHRNRVQTKKSSGGMCGLCTTRDTSHVPPLDDNPSLVLSEGPSYLPDNTQTFLAQLENRPPPTFPPPGMGANVRRLWKDGQQAESIAASSTIIDKPLQQRPHLHDDTSMTGASSQLPQLAAAEYRKLSLANSSVPPHIGPSAQIAPSLSSRMLVESIPSSIPKVQRMGYVYSDQQIQSPTLTDVVIRSRFPSTTMPEITNHLQQPTQEDFVQATAHNMPTMTATIPQLSPHTETDSIPSNVSAHPAESALSTPGKSDNVTVHTPALSPASTRDLPALQIAHSDGQSSTAGSTTIKLPTIPEASGSQIGSNTTVVLKPETKIDPCLTNVKEDYHQFSPVVINPPSLTAKLQETAFLTADKPVEDAATLAVKENTTTAIDTKSSSVEKSANVQQADLHQQMETKEVVKLPDTGSSEPALANSKPDIPTAEERIFHSQQSPSTAPEQSSQTVRLAVEPLMDHGAPMSAHLIPILQPVYFTPTIFRSAPLVNVEQSQPQTQQQQQQLKEIDNVSLTPGRDSLGSGERRRGRSLEKKMGVLASHDTTVPMQDEQRIESQPTEATPTRPTDPTTSAPATELPLKLTASQPVVLPQITAVTAPQQTVRPPAVQPTVQSDVQSVQSTALSAGESTVQHSTVQESAVQQSTVQESAVQQSVVQQSVVQQSAVQQSTVQESAVQQSTVQESAIQSIQGPTNFAPLMHTAEILESTVEHAEQDRSGTMCAGTVYCHTAPATYKVDQCGSTFNTSLFVSDIGTCSQKSATSIVRTDAASIPIHPLENGPSTVSAQYSQPSGNQSCSPRELTRDEPQIGNIRLDVSKSMTTLCIPSSSLGGSVMAKDEQKSQKTTRENTMSSTAGLFQTLSGAPCVQSLPMLLTGTAETTEHRPPSIPPTLPTWNTQEIINLRSASQPPAIRDDANRIVQMDTIEQCRSHSLEPGQRVVSSRLLHDQSVLVETRCVSSVILHEEERKELNYAETFGAENVFHDEKGEYVLRRVEIEVPEEKRVEVRTKEIRENVINKSVPIIQYKEVEVEVPQIQYVDKYVEVPQVVEKVVHKPVKKIVDTFVEKIIEKRVEQVVFKQEQREVPGEIIEVPRPYLQERKVVVPKYVDKPEPVVIAQSFWPKVREADATDETCCIDVECRVVNLVPTVQEVHIPVPVPRALLFQQLKVEHKEVPVNLVPDEQFNSLFKNLNPNLAFEDAIEYLRFLNNDALKHYKGDWVDTEFGALPLMSSQMDTFTIESGLQSDCEVNSLLFSDSVRPSVVSVNAAVNLQNSANVTPVNPLPFTPTWRPGEARSEFSNSTEATSTLFMRDASGSTATTATVHALPVNISKHAKEEPNTPLSIPLGSARLVPGAARSGEMTTLVTPGPFNRNGNPQQLMSNNCGIPLQLTLPFGDNGPRIPPQISELAAQVTSPGGSIWRSMKMPEEVRQKWEYPQQTQKGSVGSRTEERKVSLGSAPRDTVMTDMTWNKEFQTAGVHQKTLLKSLNSDSVSSRSHLPASIQTEEENAITERETQVCSLKTLQTAKAGWEPSSRTNSNGTTVGRRLWCEQEASGNRFERLKSVATKESETSKASETAKASGTGKVSGKIGRLGDVGRSAVWNISRKNPKKNGSCYGTAVPYFAKIIPMS